MQTTEHENIPKTAKLLKTETEDRNSLGDYLFLNKRETISKRNEDICELEKSRLEMRLTTLLEKEKEIFNKTKDMEHFKHIEDQENTKREMKNEEQIYLKNSKIEKSKRFDSMTYDEVYNYKLKKIIVNSSNCI